MKRISLFILTLLLLLTSLPTGYAIQKGDDKGEVLNLPPFVDFEVKEKRKVDVIVDVGNTSKSIDEVNSLVNEYLRPALQADGLDYKIHVEKSSEGMTKFYYFDNRPGDTYIYPTGLYVYDTLTDSTRMVYDTNSYQTSTDLAFYEPNSGLIFSGAAVFYTEESNIPELIRRNSGWKLGRVVIDSKGNILSTIPWGSNYYRDYYSTVDLIKEEILKNNSNDLTDALIRVPKGGIYGYTGTETINGKNLIPYLGDKFIHRTAYSTSSWGIYDDYLPYFKQETERSVSYISNFGITNYWVGDNIAYSTETGEIILPIVTQVYYDSSLGQNVATNYNVVIYDPVTKQARHIQALENIRPSVTQPRPYFLDGRQLLLYNNSVTKDVASNPVYDYLYFEDYADSGSYTLLSDMIGKTARELGTPIANIGNKVIFQGSSNGLTVVDLENVEAKTVTTNGKPYVVAFPHWYEPEKRYMRDILEEGITRSDAEKYYIRLDDTALLQLQSGKELAQLSTEMFKQNVTYIALGNDQNKGLHQKLLNAIDQRGTFIDNTNIGSAMSKAAAMVTNRKEADLHVLIANETLSLSAIKEGLKQVQTELQAENIISSINYIQGTSTSKLYDLISQINWRNDRNNYVVMFNRGSMSELNNVEYEVEVATELGSQYAGYIAIGTTANKTLNDRLIKTNKSGGVFTSSTTMSAIKTVIAKHVKDTAVKNPKRVTDTLVLNYDQETGEYSSDLIINTFYEDFENDPKFTERFKTSHDPTVYENHTGVMEGIGQYQPSPTTKFTKVGKYEMVVQVQDNPSTNAAFASYREWSLDSLSRLVLFVHRAPVADFTAVVNTSRRLTIVDLSYDLDRYSERNKGIVTAVWKWKKEDDAEWTIGSPPTTLAANTDYLISLKVKDRDGAWSNEVIKFVTTKDGNQPPVALFTVNPKTSSWSKTFTLTDQSYDPDGDTITKREWIVSKEGKQLLTKGSTPTGNEIKNAAVSAGLSQLGTYQIKLRVQDSLGLWSTWYQDYAYVVNHAPIAQFEPLTTTYRDTMNTVLNLTENPDIDGDAVTYRWRLMKGDKTYSLGTTKDVSFRIRDRGLGKDAVGTWSLELRAADPLGAESFVTHSFQVMNQIPTAEIISYPVYGYVDEPYNFTAKSDDPDTEDKSSLQYFWKLTMPSNKVITYYEKNLSNLKFNEKGKHTMEHWVMDQLGAESKVDKIEFEILNKLPIADFTRTPITTYRNTNIDFKSLGTDPDGWIEAYRYELLREGQSPLTISTDADFTRSFSSIGTFDIRHTVTDNDGASDSITKQIYIINRAPKAEVTDPSGKTAATATEFNTLTPIIRWTMTDADNDPQVQYQLQLKDQAGAVLRTTSATTTANKTFTIPSGWLTEGPTYRVAVRVYDGYDWGEYSADKYFYIMLNRPPVPGLTYSPTVIYEGDNVSIKHNVSDPDNDTLSVRYEVTAPNGQKSYYPSASGSYQLTPTQYKNNAFTINNVSKGQYTILQTVSDGRETVQETVRFTVSELGIVGRVKHTDKWNENRIDYNLAVSGREDSPRGYNVYFAGETFVLEADTTNTGSSTTKAQTVTVKIDGTSYSTTLNSTNRTLWTGEMWHKNFEKLKGEVTFTFEVQYGGPNSSGVVKRDQVTVTVTDTVYDYLRIQRLK